MICVLRRLGGALFRIGLKITGMVQGPPVIFVSEVAATTLANDSARFASGLASGYLAPEAAQHADHDSCSTDYRIHLRKLIICGPDRFCCGAARCSAWDQPDRAVRGHSLCYGGFGGRRRHCM